MQKLVHPDVIGIGGSALKIDQQDLIARIQTAFSGRGAQKRRGASQGGDTVRYGVTTAGRDPVTLL